MGFCKPPVFQQFVSVFRGPFKNERQCATRNLSFGYPESFDVDFHGVVCVVSMKMRRRMIVIIHSNGDPEKLADRRHGQIFARSRNEPNPYCGTVPKLTDSVTLAFETTEFK